MKYIISFSKLKNLLNTNQYDKASELYGKGNEYLIDVIRRSDGKFFTFNLTGMPINI